MIFFKMFSITDIFNQKNIKDAFFWLLKNKRYTFVIIFAIITIFYKYYAETKRHKKWSGIVSGSFRKLNPDGSIEFMIDGRTIMSITLTNYAIPKIYDKNSSNIDQICQTDLHIYISAKLREYFINSKPAKIIFNKDNQKGVLKNYMNKGAKGHILLDDKDLSKFLHDANLICDLYEVKNQKKRVCDWCKIKKLALSN